MLRPSRCPALRIITICLFISQSICHRAFTQEVLVEFKEHLVDASNTNSAGAAIDVDRDGRLDIVTGGYWYASPDWKKNTVREVEFIRGRFDDYACLPFDVNRDGWTDFLIGNYRSQKLGWVEHPGGGLGPWREHVVERPGPMETARTVDLDGDGNLELLPNGRDFAAWWEILPPNSESQNPQFVRHELPKEIIGHGVGAGDVDRDGRIDLVGPRGWLQGPENIRSGRWLWHGEFDLGRDASVPILVHDVDHDGDADLIWGRGHTSGIWWLEQGRVAQQRTWTPHAIDTSWSQPHTVELGDLDGDGVPELVAGKRYLGHDGKDPGEWNPLCIHWYRYSPKSGTWSRHLVSRPGSRAGFDLDPKIVDLDGDGDNDILAPGRSGLYWFENLRLAAQANEDTENTASSVPTYKYKNHRDLLTVIDSDGVERPIVTPEDWGRRRDHILRNLERVMGPLPDPSQRVPLNIEVVSQEELEGYRRIKLRYRSTATERVPAWLLVPRSETPRDWSAKKYPAMLCLHQTTPGGKNSPVGLSDSPSQHYAHELALRGYVCIVPDYPTFGEYEDVSGSDSQFVSGSMKGIWNNLRAIDLLESRADVDRERIGVIGHSLGGHHGIFTAVFDLRLRAIISSCGYTSFHDYYGGDLTGWTGPRYMPWIREKFSSDPDQLPFSFHELIAALAPRPFFSCSPLHDDNFSVTGVRNVIQAAQGVYRLHHAEGALRVEYPECNHQFPDQERHAAYAWLDEVMRKAP